MKAEPVTLRRIGAGLTVAAALLTSACAAGQKAQTADQYATLDGVNAKSGDITLGGVVLESPQEASYAAGSDVALKAVIVNSGRQDDQLTSITSSSADGWAAFASSADATAFLDSRSAAAGSSSGSAPGAPQPEQSVTIPAGARVSYGTPEAKGTLLLLHTKAVLHPGSSVRLSFTFATAGTVSVTVPVQLSSAPQTSVVPGPSATGQEG